MGGLGSRIVVNLSKTDGAKAYLERRHKGQPPSQTGVARPIEFGCVDKRKWTRAGFELLGQDLEPTGTGLPGPADGETGLVLTVGASPRQNRPQ